MVNSSMMTIDVVIEEDVLRLICEYAPLCGRRLEGKQYFIMS